MRQKTRVCMQLPDPVQLPRRPTAWGVCVLENRSEMLQAPLLCTHSELPLPRTRRTSYR